MQLSLMKESVKLSDVVATPQWAAELTVNHFKPSGLCLDPCRGNGVFHDLLPDGSDWCEIAEGKDFFLYDNQVDWVIGNPPYSIFSPWLQHSMTIAENIVYVIPINKVFNSSKTIRSIGEWGGIRAILHLGHGSMFNIGLGFAIGAVHLQRGYNGNMEMIYNDKE